MKYILNDYLEMQRDQFNASLIVDMDCNEHQRRLEAAEKQFGRR